MRSIPLVSRVLRFEITFGRRNFPLIQYSSYIWYICYFTSENKIHYRDTVSANSVSNNDFYCNSVLIHVSVVPRQHCFLLHILFTYWITHISGPFVKMGEVGESVLCTHVYNFYHFVLYIINSIPVSSIPKFLNVVRLNIIYIKFAI